MQRVEQRRLSAGWPDVILQVRVDVSRTETCSYLFPQVTEFAADPGNEDVECHGSLFPVELASRPGCCAANGLVGNGMGAQELAVRRDIIVGAASHMLSAGRVYPRDATPR